MSFLIPCQCCGQEFSSVGWTWWVCDKCGYRVCAFCLSKHSGPYSTGGYKCSQCMFGTMKMK